MIQNVICGLKNSVPQQCGRGTGEIIMSGRTNEKRLLVVFLANDNHLSNVKTLQSIYKQDYPNIHLAVCNDCTDQFQSERLLNNFQAYKPANIRQIWFHENTHPMGEYRSQKQFWDRVDADYTITLHSGEYFTSPQALTNCARYLQCDSSVSAVAVAAELWSDDMKQCISVYSAMNRTVDVEEEQLRPQIENLRDCMLMCRIDALQNLNVCIGQDETPVSQVVCSALLERGETVTALPMPLCKFSEASIRNTAVSVPNTYGNILLQSVSSLLRSSPARDLGTTVAAAPSETTCISDKNRSRNLKLYQYSRFSRLKYYAVIDLLLIICAMILTLSQTAIRDIAAIILTVAAVILFVWTVSMLICNLYFKKNPQRLV